MVVPMDFNRVVSIIIAILVTLQSQALFGIQP